MTTSTDSLPPYHAKKQPQVSREWASWCLLFEWAALGGKPDEAVTQATTREGM